MPNLFLVRCVENRPAYFAERLYKSMKGMGTDDRSLIRLVVSRCEVDMADIKAAFQDAYGKTLESFITVSAHFHLVQYIAISFCLLMGF